LALIVENYARLIYASLPIDIAAWEMGVKPLTSFYGNNFQFIRTGAYIQAEYLFLLLAIISQSNVFAPVSLETASSAASAVLITPDGWTRSTVCDYEVVLQ